MSVPRPSKAMARRSALPSPSLSSTRMTCSLKPSSLRQSGMRRWISARLSSMLVQARDSTSQSGFLRISIAALVRRLVLLT
jgi:hypothetical protein